MKLSTRACLFLVTAGITSGSIVPPDTRAGVSAPSDGLSANTIAVEDHKAALRAFADNIIARLRGDGIGEGVDDDLGKCSHSAVLALVKDELSKALGPLNEALQVHSPPAVKKALPGDVSPAAKYLPHNRSQYAEVTESDPKPNPRNKEVRDCKTVAKNWKEDSGDDSLGSERKWCTSCHHQSHWFMGAPIAFIPQNAKAKAGMCGAMRTLNIMCTALHQNSGHASPDASELVCTKFGIAEQDIPLLELEQTNPEAYAHFKPAYGGQGRPVIGRCELVKHVACVKTSGNGERSCAVRKDVKCREVCRPTLFDQKTGKFAWDRDCVKVANSTNCAKPIVWEPVKPICFPEMCKSKFAALACARVAQLE